MAIFLIGERDFRIKILSPNVDNPDGGGHQVPPIGTECIIGYMWRYRPQTLPRMPHRRDRKQPPFARWVAFPAYIHRRGRRAHSDSHYKYFGRFWFAGSFGQARNRQPPATTSIARPHQTRKNIGFPRNLTEAHGSSNLTAAP